LKNFGNYEKPKENELEKLRKDLEGNLEKAS